MLFHFRNGIIYNQTWEDPYVDAEALKIDKDDIVVALASGGCNILNMALLGPSTIYAIDRNPAQIELLSPKIAGAKYLDYEEYWRCFGLGNVDRIKALYDRIRLIAPEEGAHFERRLPDISPQGLYRTGRLNTLYTLGDWIRRTCSDTRLQRFARAETIKAQEAIYRTEIKPRLWNFPNRYIPSVTMALYGVSGRQIRGCLLNRQLFLKDLFEKRFDHLFTTIPMRKNYFWQRIFFGEYPDRSICPPYLQENNFNALKTRVARIILRVTSMTDFLKTQKDSSITVFNLSDLPDFLSAAERKKLWDEVARTSRNGARVLYRNFTAGRSVPRSTLARFEIAREKSASLSAKEMTGSYAEVLLFTVKK